MNVRVRMVRDEREREQVLRYLANEEPPYSVSVVPGESRSHAQNRLQQQWFADAAAQGDMAPADYRAFCKLHFGVPLLREENSAFREQYDRVVKERLDYESKLAIMLPPIDFPVTRLMNKGQFTRYLDAIWQHFTGLGFQLTAPSLLGIESLMEGKA